MIVVDTETELIRPGERVPRLVCTSFVSGKHKGILIANPVGLTRSMVWLRDEQVSRSTARVNAFSSSSNFWSEVLREDEIVGCNIAYDLAVVIRAHPELALSVWKTYDDSRVTDTLLCDKLRYIANGRLQFDPTIGKEPHFSLAALAYRHLGLELAKGEDTWRLRYGELIDLGIEDWPDDALRYSMTDAEVTAKVMESIHYRSPDEWLQTRAAWALHLMSAWGMTTDPARVQELRRSLEERCREYEAQLRPSGLVDDRGKRSMAAIRALLRAQALTRGEEPVCTDATERYPQGQVRTDADTLRESGVPILETLADYLEVKKTLTDFVPKLTPLVQPSFDSLKATGRVSCYGPNLEQVPRKGGVRECFIPRPGFRFVIADYSSAELCAIAELCYDQFGRSRLGDYLKQGVDVHMLIGARLLGVGYEQAMVDRARWKEDPTYAPGRQANDARELGKRGNFGRWGGMGDPKFVVVCRKGGISIDLRTSHQIKLAMLDFFPEMHDYFDAVAAQGENHSFRQYKSGRWRGGLSYCDGCNTQFQGLVADGTKDMLYHLSRACYVDPGVLQGSRPVNFIHDEVITEVPIPQAERAKDEIERLMVETMSRWITRVPIKVEARITDRWTK